ncbi:hypothetical protein [Caulobacter sp. 602-1]|uniref:hypothetical protein n=1 Tax=Caulobacter sp. 602-1 TaxID=2492472 RepID=UPI000F6366FC|nr:hypothetical protein [Caulobacter sp. 602-1]RRN63489.1 hypothetical protein EIK80_16885 [Caulobacter sp. 602-1]
MLANRFDLQIPQPEDQGVAGLSFEKWASGQKKMKLRIAPMVTHLLQRAAALFLGLARMQAKGDKVVEPLLLSTERNYLDWEKLYNLPFAKRIDVDENGDITSPYCALDPMNAAWLELPEHASDLSRMRPLKDHIVRVHELLLACVVKGALRSARPADASWEGVRYALQMAASLEDVFADTAVTDDGAMYMCSGAAEFEFSHSEMASKYMAGLITFNFLWSAYEGAREISPYGRVLTGRAGNKSRELSRLTAGASEGLPYFRACLHGALTICQRGGGLDEHIRATVARSAGSTAELAADLCRTFRHHVYHGDDKVPEPSDWGAEDLSGLRSDKRVVQKSPQIDRFYAVCRLALMNIQLMIISSLESAGAFVEDFEFDDFIALDIELSAAWLLAHAHVVFDSEFYEISPPLPFDDYPPFTWKRDKEATQTP